MSDLDLNQRVTVEVGTETYPVSVQELTGTEWDRIYAEQARRIPLFAEHAVTWRPAVA
jgi:hypothetical protein